MTVELVMKIGTIPMGRMRVKYARKNPAVGTMVYVKPAGRRGKWEKWHLVRIDSYIDYYYCKASYV